MRQEDLSVKGDSVVDSYQVLERVCRLELLSEPLTLGSLRVITIVLECSAGISRCCLEQKMSMNNQSLIICLSGAN